MRPIVSAFFGVGSLLLFGAVAAGQSPVPVPVSPGNGGAAAVIEQTCPTFSWGGVPGAEEYELAVFLVSEDTEPGQAVPEGVNEPVLFVRVPGSATSWTPARSQCFDAERRYAWALRVAGEGYEGEWSRVQVFRVEPQGELPGLEGVLKRVVEEMVTDGKITPREAGVLRQLVRPRPPEGVAPHGPRSALESSKAPEPAERRVVVEKELALEKIELEEMPQESVRRETVTEDRQTTEAPGPGSSLGQDLRLFDGSDVEKFELRSQLGSGGALSMSTDAATTSLVLDSEFGTGFGSLLSMRAPDVDGLGMVETVQLGADLADDRSGRLLLRGQGSAGGFTSTVDLRATEGLGGAQLTLDRVDGFQAIEIDAQFGAAGWPRMVMFAQDSGGTRRETIEIEARENNDDNGAQIQLRKLDGTTSIILDAEVGTGGPGRIDTPVLQITGGADLSEQFAVRGGGGVEPEPGMVVSIDPAGSGELIVSRRSHDRTAVGVISGAGGLHPGLLMGQTGSEADGELPVALTGRVYVQVDASHGPIRPGDLLTSSPTPGLAMRVSDHQRAQGAVLGKAMTGLAEGQGLVLALISLQ